MGRPRSDLWLIGWMAIGQLLIFEPNFLHLENEDKNMAGLVPGACDLVDIKGRARSDCSVNGPLPSISFSLETQNKNAHMLQVCSCSQTPLSQSPLQVSTLEGFQSLLRPISKLSVSACEVCTWAHADNSGRPWGLSPARAIRQWFWLLHKDHLQKTNFDIGHQLGSQ